jgi:hypothetical protein
VIICTHPRTSLTSTGASSGVPEITDTEEVTGSNPVSPTVTPLVSDLFATMRARLAPGSVDLSAKLCRPIACMIPFQGVVVVGCPRLARDVEAEHHPALHVLGDMAMGHPQPGIGDVEHDVHRQ